MGLPPTESGLQGTEVILAFLRLQADCCPWRTLECKAVDAGRIQMWLSPTRQVVAIPAAKDGAPRFVDRLTGYGAAFAGRPASGSPV
jgi:hypothetical protein